MPRHIIKRRDWDRFLVKLEREDDEKVVAVARYGVDRLEVFTQPLNSVLRRMES